MGHPIKHFVTITKHRHLVIRLCFKAGIGLQGLRHDLSKYSPTEFCAGAKYYTGTCSPINVEERLFGYSESWLHHKGKNRHHFEYWTYYSSADRAFVPIKMPLKYVKEMFCDRVAATMVYNKENYVDALVLNYYNDKNSKYGLHPDTAKLLEKWLTTLAEKGLEESLKEVKQLSEY